MYSPLFGAAEPEGTLYTGIPPWLAQPLATWNRQVLSRAEGRGYRTTGLALVERFDRLTRQPLPLAPDYSRGGYDYMIQSYDESIVLELAHFLLNRIITDHEPGTGAWQIDVARLEVLLKEAGSEWTVSVREGAEGLEKRVPTAVRSAAQAAMDSAGAGPVLSAAWAHAFGRSPDPSRAYGDAIRAVEEASIPVVQPKYARATLGTVIGQMKSDGDWAVPIEHANKLLVTEMCDQLWGGQTDRHGANNSHAPSQGAAEAAVLLAVTLVQWFTSGAVARR